MCKNGNIKVKVRESAVNQPVVVRF